MPAERRSELIGDVFAKSMQIGFNTELSDQFADSNVILANRLCLVRVSRLDEREDLELFGLEMTEKASLELSPDSLQLRRVRSIDGVAELREKPFEASVILNQIPTQSIHDSKLSNERAGALK
jgi:hypothetical protein